LVEAAKGFAAVTVGDLITGDAGAIAAGIGAVLGNVFNLYYRLHGGKGLGITLGILAGVWPTVLIPVLVVLIAGLAVLRSSGGATIVAIFGLNALALAWWQLGWPTAWGVRPSASLALLSVSIGAIIWRRHWADYMIKRRARPGTRGSASPAPR
jgi:glycerol-3-phosphate acyltransferase PlsY